VADADVVRLEGDRGVLLGDEPGDQPGW
jgi:hypothetical protein